MRAFIAALGTFAILSTIGCTTADEGNLLIRGPGVTGAIAVTDGGVTIDGVALRIGADLTAARPSSRG